MARARTAPIRAQAKRSTRITTRGRMFAIVAVVLFIAAYAIGNQLLLFIACLLAILVIVAVLLARFRSMKLGISRSFSPSPVEAHSPTTVTIEARNQASIRSAPLFWNDTIPWSPNATEAMRLDSLGTASARPSSRTTKLSYILTPPRRGIFKVGPLVLAYSDPFGIAVGFVTLGKPSDLTVTPWIAELPMNGLWLEAPDGAARLVQTAGVGNADDLMTREYRRGDALRRVHWKASARHGQLMVRQEEQRSYPEATIAIDTRHGSYTDPWEYGHDNDQRYSPRFEWSVTMLASLGVHLHRAGFVVHIAESAERQVVGLADSEARHASESDFLLSLAAMKQKSAKGKPDPSPVAAGPVFAILSQGDEDTLEWLLKIKKPSGIGAAFVVGGAPEVSRRLSGAGWHVVPVDVGSDPVVAWAVLTEELGLAREA